MAEDLVHPKLCNGMMTVGRDGWELIFMLKTGDRPKGRNGWCWDATVHTVLVLPLEQLVFNAFEKAP